MKGFDNRSYGDAFADVYDDWYEDISDVPATVADLLELADGGNVLELGVGTGRIAVPLARLGGASGVTVTGVESSAAMLARLAERDPAGLVEAIHGDMVSDLGDGPYALVFAAYNTLFSLTSVGAQAACFAAVASSLRPNGRFVIEAFVPDDHAEHTPQVSVRTLDADRVVLSVSVTASSEQSAAGQFIEFTEAGGVRLRPWSIRYSTPAQLDAMAVAAGFDLEFRWASFGRTPFGDDSTRHVSTYRKLG